MLYARLNPDTETPEARDFAEPPPAGKNWVPVQIEPIPVTGENDILLEGPVEIEALPTSEGDPTYSAKQGWIVQKRQFVVSPRQIRQALTAVGMRDSIEIGVANSSRDVKDWWEFATTFESDHPIVVSMCDSLGINEEQRLSVFALAEML